MAGTISCATIVTSEISSESSIKIGSFNWPTGTPVSGSVLKTSGDGSLTFEYSSVRVAIDPTDTTYTITGSDDIVAITGTLDTTLKLPDPATKVVGDFIHISKEVSGGSVITIVPHDQELISGETSVSNSSSYGSLKVYTNGKDYFALI